MHTVELLEEALTLAREMHFGIRTEWLGGAGGGVCRIKGEPWIFLDVAQPHREQLDVVLDAIREEVSRAPDTITIPAAIAPLIGRQAA